MEKRISLQLLKKTITEMIMKRLILPILILTALITGCKSKSLEISGVIDSAKAGDYIYIDELKKDELATIDSANIGENGKFRFKLKAETPKFFLIKITEANFMTVISGPGEKVFIEAHRDSLNSPVSVKGSVGTEKLIQYNMKLKKAIADLTELSQIYDENVNNPDLLTIMDDLDRRAQAVITDLNEYTKSEIDKDPGSLASLIALYQQIAPGAYVLNPEKDLAWFIRVDSALYSKYPESEPVIALHEQVANLISRVNAEKQKNSVLSEGAVAPEIALPNAKGDTIRLSSTRGNIVLLDFWAAWCPPCREESPNLVNAYNQFKDKGFTIYQVSLDNKREAWLLGIEEDKLGRWTHVSDLKYWSSSVVPLYKIEGIPHNLLLDKEGRIIAKDLRGDALVKTLNDLFNL